MTVFFRTEEVAYLIGYFAAKLTKTGKIGFIGSYDSGPIARFREGFSLGMLKANKDVQLVVRYIASYADMNKTKILATTMAASGVVVLFPVTGGAGHGVIELAREKNIYVIGTDFDQSHLAPNQIITSLMKNVSGDCE